MLQCGLFDTAKPVSKEVYFGWQRPRALYGLALKPKRWHTGRRGDGESITAFAMKHIQPFRSQLLNTVPIHYLLAFGAIGIRNYRWSLHALHLVGPPLKGP